jgi:hypothetical protein
MIKTILLVLGIALAAVLCICIPAFMRKTRLGNHAGYKDKHPHSGRG